MDIVNDLIRRRAACEQEIAEQDRKIQEYERAYESLRRFDGAVDTAQSNFHNVNTVKLNRTSELSSITSRLPYSTALSGGLTENSERIRGKDRRGGIYRAGCDDTAETCGVQTEDTEL